MEVVKEVFRSYDIRGVYENGITNDLAYLIGKAFGTYSNGNKVVVGHDARTSSNALNTNLIKGLLEAGVDVLDIGLCTTPMIYYAREFFNLPYAIMITASHCPKEQNGFKLSDKDGCMYGDKVMMIYDIIMKNNFNVGNGLLSSYDLMYDYRKLMSDKIKLGNRKIKAVVDCGNGTTSIINPSIINDWGVDVIPLYCTSDPSFPNHIPDPAVVKNTYDLQKKVIEEKADLGISFDGDGDRIGIIDEKGNYLAGDKLMIYIWKNIYDKVKNKTASFDVKCSNVLKETLESLGLKTNFNKTGHSYLKKAIKENNYDFAGEFSGHMCFNDDFYGYDDALYVSGRVLMMLSNTNLNISDYFNDVPIYYSSNEDYIEVGEQKKYEIVDKVKEYANERGYELITIDGARIEFNDGFALVRVSNTTPCITVRFEAKTEDAMKKYQEEIMNIVNNTK